MGASSDVARTLRAGMLPIPGLSRRERRVSQAGTAAGEEEDGMPRYLIERTFPEGLYPPDVEEAPRSGARSSPTTLMTW